MEFSIFLQQSLGRESLDTGCITVLAEEMLRYILESCVMVQILKTQKVNLKSTVSAVSHGELLLAVVQHTLH